MNRSIARIDDPVVAISINKTYRDGMSAGELYNRTRGTWKVSSSHCDKAHYAFAVYRGEIKEVYEIHEWLPSGSEECIKLVGRPKSYDGRSCFIGSVAPSHIREKYVGKLMPDRFYGNPIRYYNC